MLASAKFYLLMGFMATSITLLIAVWLHPAERQEAARRITSDIAFWFYRRWKKTISFLAKRASALGNSASDATKGTAKRLFPQDTAASTHHPGVTNIFYKHPKKIIAAVLGSIALGALVTTNAWLLARRIGSTAFSIDFSKWHIGLVAQIIVAIGTLYLATLLPKAVRRIVGIAIGILLIVFVGKKVFDYFSESHANIEQRIVAETNRRVKMRLASQDTTYHLTVTDEWSAPIITLADQCVHFTRQDSVAYEERFDDGSILFVPKSIKPNKTQTKIIDTHGRVIETLVADEYGRFSIIGRRGRQIRVFGAKAATFEVRVKEI